MLRTKKRTTERREEFQKAFKETTAPAEGDEAKECQACKAERTIPIAQEGRTPQEPVPTLLDLLTKLHAERAETRKKHQTDKTRLRHQAGDRLPPNRYYQVAKVKAETQQRAKKLRTWTEEKDLLEQ